MTKNQLDSGDVLEESDKVHPRRHIKRYHRKQRSQT